MIVSKLLNVILLNLLAFLGTIIVLSCKKEDAKLCKEISVNKDINPLSFSNCKVIKFRYGKFKYQDNGRIDEYYFQKFSYDSVGNFEAFEGLIKKFNGKLNNENLVSELSVYDVSSPFKSENISISYNSNLQIEKIKLNVGYSMFFSFLPKIITSNIHYYYIGQDIQKISVLGFSYFPLPDSIFFSIDGKPDTLKNRLKPVKFDYDVVYFYKGGACPKKINPLLNLYGFVFGNWFHSRLPISARYEFREPGSIREIDPLIFKSGKIREGDELPTMIGDIEIGYRCP